jgi:succinate dehydrogenase flavin-adding protein (antitoxin of CptAB toxin-antitoxin module)
MKELDLLLTRYLAECWPCASEAEKVLFESFLELPDPAIVGYLMGHEPAPDPALQGLLAALRSDIADPAARLA